MNKSVVLGISGGIDSAVSALILKNKGYKITGVYLKTQTESENPHQDARVKRIAADLEFPLHILDISADFTEKVIGNYVHNHFKGYTPSPCSYCNPVIKWPHLIHMADKLDCDCIATGHYIRIIETNNTFFIHQAQDKLKDQSYFLWNLSQDVLSKTITPLGSYSKNQVRAMASEYGLNYLDTQKESTGLCFAHGLSCEETILRYAPDFLSKVKQGNVIDSNNNIIGTHKGYPFYTVGQKKGLNLDIPEKYCVKEIIPETNTLVADKWQNLYSRSFTVTNVNTPDLHYLLSDKNLLVKVRGFGLNPDGKAHIKQIDENVFSITVNVPAWAPAPGQPAVFYNDDILVGGGIIQKVQFITSLI